MSDRTLLGAERAAVLRAFEQWGAERPEERALRQDVAQFIRERVVEAGVDEDHEPRLPEATA